MKENVDLTQNRAFSSQGIFERPLDVFKIRSFYSHNLAKRTSKILEDKGYVLQGNQHDREMKRIVAKFNDKKECDRCGAQIFPYENDTLCAFCREDLSYQASLDNIFWLNRR